VDAVVLRNAILPETYADVSVLLSVPADELAPDRDQVRADVLRTIAPDGAIE